MKGIYLPMSVIRELGVEAALLYCYVLNRLNPSEGNKVALSIREVLADTGMKDYTQRKLFKVLEGEGYLQTSIVMRHFYEDNCEDESVSDSKY